MALTTAQMLDVRRFAGYQAQNTGVPFGEYNDIVYLSFGMIQMSLQKRLSELDADTEAVLINKYLDPLNALEDAIISASDNLDTDAAAVWTHNKNEVSDRTKLFNQIRRSMCDFLGIKAGEGLGGGVKLVRA